MASSSSSWSPIITTDFVSETWSTVLLSLRDLRRDVPINYNHYPGISLTPACFADAHYTPDKADCVADLIAIGYRSFLLDLYLDGVSGSWGICPGDIDIPNNNTSTAPLSSPGQSQTSVCNPAFNATTLLTIFDTWMTGTNTDLGARILLLTLNLHPTTTTTTTTNTNRTSTTTTAYPLTDTLKSANILADAYTPTRLLSDRSDLTSTWHAYADPDTAPTNDTYFTTTLLPDGTATTPDGWPSESYLEFKIGKRVLLSFGSIDTSLSYDPATTGDDATIFPASYLGSPAVVNNASRTAPHCFFEPEATSVAAANASWAQVLVSDAGATAEDVAALVDCGYSTLLDPEVGVNETAAERFSVFGEHIEATAAWAWDEGQPVNTTGKKETFRCAAVSVRDGRWSVVDCEERLLAACRIGGEPYQWTLTPTPQTYSTTAPTTALTATTNCSFSAPRTPLENTHLLYALRRASLPTAMSSVYIDLNSLSVDSCWVSGGANATCPYAAADDGNREVIVSAVAALIVLIVAGLMWFAKGASWRVERSRRRRRRAAKKRVREGVEYEGVPS